MTSPVATSPVTNSPVASSPVASSPPRVAAIVLAAGVSRRMGSPKPLLPLAGQPMLARVLETLDASQAVSPVVVVTGAAADQLQPILAGHCVTIAHNPDYERGEMLSSIKTGLRALPREIEATLIVLCDQPMVRAATIATLVATWRARRPRILLPTCQGKRGHPIVLSTVGFNEIISLPPDATLKSYTCAYPAVTIALEVDDPAVARDIDTPADYQRESREAEQKLQQRSQSCTDKTATV